MTPYTFLSSIWQGKPDDLPIQLWALQNKQSYYCTQPSKAARIVESCAQARYDVYFGVGLAPRDYGTHARCPASEIAGIFGLWADIDMMSPHRKPNARLPTTTEEALSLLPAILPPTYVLHSGYGLQPGWVFREVLLFGSDEERQWGHQLAYDLQETIRFQALRHNWEMDRLADLARLMRIPGTLNLKDPAKPKPVEMLEFHENRRYNPSEIREYLDTIFKSEAAAAGRRVVSAPGGAAAAPAMAEPAKPAEPAPVNSPSVNETKEGQAPIQFTYDPRARIPKETLQLWLEDPKLNRLWHHKRVPGLKQLTPSNFDLAVANWLRDIGATQQQIVDAITHMRALHHSKEHHNHPDYLTRTLDKCFNHHLAPAAPPAPTEKKTKKQKEEEALPPLNPEDPYGELACAWGFEIQKIIKVDGQHPTYQIETPTRMIGIPNESTWLNQKAFTGIILGQLNKVIPQTFSDKKWRRLVAIAMNAITIIAADEENDFRGSAVRSLRRYLSTTSFIISPEGLNETDCYRPMVRHGGIAVSSGDYAEYLQAHGERTASAKEAAGRLKAAGAEHILVQGGRRFRAQNRWLLPVAEFPPEEYASKQSIASEIAKEGEVHAPETQRTNGSEH